MELIIDLFIMILWVYFYTIFAYILLGWIVEVRRSSFYRALGVVVEPFFRVFRGWLVFGRMDFTPMLGLFLFQILLELLSTNL